MNAKKLSLRDRLLSKAVINWETGCWEWTACLDRKGYGRFQIGNRNRGAHRVAYELLVGPIPEGLQLDHLCRVRNCINPAHLEPVTSQENSLRSPLTFQTKNAAKTHCVAGHEFTPESTHINRRGSRICRTCRRETNKLFFAANPDKRREYERRWKQKRQAAPANHAPEEGAKL